MPDALVRVMATGLKADYQGNALTGPQVSQLTRPGGSLEKGDAMKVILKKEGEERYLVREGVWTENVMEAEDFKSFLPLLDYRREHNIEGVEAFFWFDDPKY